MTNQPSDDLDDEGSISEAGDVLSERDIKAKELLDNAAKVKGADFANYAATLIELAQLNLMVTKLATGKVEGTEAVMMVAMATQLTTSIDSKVFTNMSMPDRVEAGKLAAQVAMLTRKAGG